MELFEILATGKFNCMDVMVPGKLVNIVHLIITIIKFGVPVLLIIFGMLDLGKAVMASKEDEIKKGQQMFIKRLIAAIIVFFVVVVVQLVVGVAAGEGDSKGISDCLDGFVNGVNCPANGGECTLDKSNQGDQ